MTDVVVVTVVEVVFAIVKIVVAIISEFCCLDSDRSVDRVLTIFKFSNLAKKFQCEIKKIYKKHSSNIGLLIQKD